MVLFDISILCPRKGNFCNPTKNKNNYCMIGPYFINWKEENKSHLIVSNRPITFQILVCLFFISHESWWVMEAPSMIWKCNNYERGTALICLHCLLRPQLGFIFFKFKTLVFFLRFRHRPIHRTYFPKWQEFASEWNIVVCLIADWCNLMVAWRWW